VPKDIYDFIAVGVGPFNLSLACMTSPINSIRALFLERRSDFDWHPGLLIDNCTLQNPFLADLVSLADPRSEYSYLNYCKNIGRIYSYYMRENYHLNRSEYNRYCQWVVNKLSNIYFNHEVESILYDDDDKCYIVSGQNVNYKRRFVFRSRKLVLGIGTQPVLPDCCANHKEKYIHSAEYLDRKKELQRKKSITIVGSGQSAAEIFHDLLRESQHHAYTLCWITRSTRFFQMENTKLTLELISPDYTEYFFDIPDKNKRRIISNQDSLYKGINAALINQIYDLLDEKIHCGDRRYKLQTNSELRNCKYSSCSNCYDLDFYHLEHDVAFKHFTDGLVLATGYAPSIPAFINPIRERITWADDGKYKVARNYTIDITGGEIFVQNTGILSHGVTNPDLGFCCYRNSQILREITGQEHYMVEPRVAIQNFGPPQDGVLRNPCL